MEPMLYKYMSVYIKYLHYIYAEPEERTPAQNRRQKVFNRVVLQFCGLICAGGFVIIKLTQNSTYLQCFTFQFGKAWSFAWGAKPTKGPVAIGLPLYPSVGGVGQKGVPNLTEYLCYGI